MTPRYYGLLANTTKPGAAEMAAQLARRLGTHGYRGLLDDKSAALLTDRVAQAGVNIVHPWEIGQKAEFVIVLGGDGTLLKAVRLFEPRVPPFAAINLGSLGFLTTAPIAEAERCIDALVKQEYEISARARLEVSYTTCQGETRTDTALNEAVFARGVQPRMIDLEARIGGECFNRYRSDGLIVATPTGSTAYALSAGGPLISPNAGVFLLTPICSHTMADRSLVFSDTTELEIIPSREDAETLLTLDGEPSIPLPVGVPVRLRRAAQDLPLITLPGHNFFRVVQAKLGWRGNTMER